MKDVFGDIHMGYVSDSAEASEAEDPFASDSNQSDCGDRFATEGEGSELNCELFV